jgi:DNA-binding sugar fermentation-stimulating protein
MLLTISISKMLLHKLDNLIEGQIIKRPSKHIKTPYVADVKIIDNDTEILGHTPALGCCGLSDVGSTILMSPTNPTNKCSYSIYLSIIKEREQNIIVGIHPKLAELLTESALKMNLLSKLKNCKQYRREIPIYIPNKVDSRFDFTGIDENNIPFIMEVKNVPLADYEDLPSKERKNYNFSDRDINSKVAYFPDGYRKKKIDTVSPRALKHITELTTIKSESAIRCIMCYVIQRTDVNRFQPSVIDPIYRDAFIQAVNTGVEIITLVVSWNADGEAYFVRDDLPVNL